MATASDDNVTRALPDQPLGLAMQEAQGHLAAGRLAQAADTLAPELPMRRRHSVPGDLLEVGAHNLMGVIAKFRGQFDLAAHHYALVAASPALADSPEMAAALEHNLGGLAHSCGDLEAAERHTRAALEMNMALTGDSSFEVLSDLGQLGAILSQRAAVDEAIEALTRARDGFVTLFGGDHVEVGTAITALGAAWHRKGDLPAAERLYREGLAIRSRATGADHPDLAWTMVNLAVVLRRSGRPAEAEELLQRAQAVLEGNVAADHPLLRKLQDRRPDTIP